MHVLQHLLVNATDESRAISSADIVAGQAEWSDWYQVGGRWNNEFSERFPDISSTLRNGNVLPVWEYPSQAVEVLQGAVKRQDRAFLEARDALVGNPVAVSDVSGHIFGLPIADSAGAAKRISETNRKHSQEWQAILSSSTLEEAQQSFSLSTHYAQRLVALIDSVWNPDSAFFDAISHSTNPRYLLQALTGAGGSTSEYSRDIPLFLVTVDFHF